MDYPAEDHIDTERFIAKLHNALTGSLPGTEAQHKMAPLGHRQPVGPPDDVRQSAVLALLHQREIGGLISDTLSLVFTLRPNSLRHHAGQISFPGGGAEPHDNSLARTALRETSEELGIPTSPVRILGELTPLYIAPSHNLVQPYVGWMPRLPPLDPDPVEVSKVFTIRLAYLLDPLYLGSHTWHRNGESLTAPCYEVPAIDEYGTNDSKIHIWGATAMILSELLAIIRPLLAQI